MTDEADECDDAVAGLLADVAEDYLARRARGEVPDPEEYAARHPEAADAIRGVLGALRLAAPPSTSRLIAPSLLALSPHRPGELSDYRIVRELGRGGMGVVYEAEQVSLRRRVALKVFPSAAVADPRHLQRFRNEALAAAALDHPHVVKVYGVGADPGVHHIAMQFVDGRTLADLIRKRRESHGDPAEVRDADRTTDATGGRTEPAAARSGTDSRYSRQVAEWGGQAAEALEHAHSLGIVHRDVKPGNLLIDGAGQLFVADFGLAKVGTDPGVTEPGDLLGTVRYMSPEQASARHGLVDHRSDVYSLGATLYELLTLCPAFDGEDRSDILRRVAADDPVPPRRIDRRIPAALETVVLKAMAKEPARRYQSARELADDLRRFLDDRPVLARPPSLGEWVGNWSRRHRAVVRAGLAALVVAVAALATSTLLVARSYESEARHRKDAEDAAVRADEARQEVSDREKRLRLELYPTDLVHARQAWESGEPDRLRELLDRHRPRDGEADLRGFEWHYLDACARTEERVFAGHEFPLLSADLTGDGRLVATSDRGGVVKLWDAASGRELHSARYSNQEVTCVRFSPDGRTLATCGQDRTIRLFNVDTWAESARLAGHTGTVTAVCWSPGGTQLASGGRDHAVKVWNVATRAVARSLVGHADAVLCVAWSPDGKLLASAGKDPEVRLWNTANGSSAGVLTGHAAGDLLCLAFNPSGRFLASGGYGNVAIVHDALSRQPAYRVEAPGAAWSLAFSPDDRYLLVGRSRRVEVWDAGNSSRAVPVRTLAHPGRVRALAVSQDSRTLLTASEEGREARLADATRLTGHTRVRYPTLCWMVAPDRGLAVCSEPSASVTLRRFPGGELVQHLGGGVLNHREAAFFPAGNLLVINDLDGKLSLWDTATGRRVRDLTGHTSAVFLAVSPDGSYIAGGGRGLTHVWRPDTGELVTTLRLAAGWIVPPAFSPDGSVLATADGTQIVLWRVGTWSRQSVLEGSQSSNVMVFSPNSGVLAAGGDVHGVTLWEVGTGRRLAVLAERTGPVTGVAFSPDGQTLATLGGDRTVRLWHVPTRRELFTLYRHDAPLLWARFASSTQLLVGAESSTPGQSEVFVFPPLDR